MKIHFELVTNLVLLISFDKVFIIFMIRVEKLIEIFYVNPNNIFFKLDILIPCHCSNCGKCIYVSQNS